MVAVSVLDSGTASNHLDERSTMVKMWLDLSEERGRGGGSAGPPPCQPGGRCRCRSPDGRSAEGALSQVEDESSLLKVAKHLLKVDEVLLPVPAGHQDVVHVDEYEVKPVEDVVHVALKRHTGVF